MLKKSYKHLDTKTLLEPYAKVFLSYRLVAGLTVLACSRRDVVFGRASSGEAAGRIILCDKLGLLVSHLLCLHIIPLEYIPLVCADGVVRVTAPPVFALCKNPSMEFTLFRKELRPNFVWINKKGRGSLRLPSWGL